MISLESKIAPFSASWSGPGFWATAVGTRGGVAIRMRREKKTFLQLIPAFFFPNSRPLIDGDFYCCDSTLDKMGTASLDSSFTFFKESCRLRDVWRSLYPRDKQFTWLVLICRLPVD